MSINVKKYSIILGVMIALAGGALWLSDNPLDIDVETEEQRQKVKDTLSGQWYSNDGTCDKELVYYSLQEFTFGTNLPRTAINPIKYDQFTIEMPKATESVDALTNWFNNCDAFTAPEFAPVKITSRSRTNTEDFYYYPEHNLILLIEGDSVLPLMRLDDLRLFQSRTGPKGSDDSTPS